MYRRKSKPDLLFTLTVFVCLGVLLTATVNAAEVENGHWGINLSAENGCGEALGEWRGCSQWQLGSKVDGQAPYRAALRLSSEERPDLGVVWYYTKPGTVSSARREYGLASAYGLEQEPAQGQFGVVVKQQYRHFGLSLGIEADRPEGLTNEPLLYFGINNHW